jgi:hypothetical protein
MMLLAAARRMTTPGAIKGSPPDQQQPEPKLRLVKI